MRFMSASTLSINAWASSKRFGHSKALALKGLCNVAAAANAGQQKLGHHSRILRSYRLG